MLRPMRGWFSMGYSLCAAVEKGRLPRCPCSVPIKEDRKLLSLPDVRTLPRGCHGGFRRRGSFSAGQPAGFSMPQGWKSFLNAPLETPGRAPANSVEKGFPGSGDRSESIPGH